MQRKPFPLSPVFFFGALWGLLEATLGYGLQFLPPLVSGSVMFPIGAVILFSAYKHTNDRRAVFFVGVVAASIKALNFFAPGLMPIKTYNPMIAILMQSLFIVACIPLLRKRSFGRVFAGFLVASVGWRLTFLANIATNHALTGFPFGQLESLAATGEFVLLSGLLGAFFGLALFFLGETLGKRLERPLAIRPSLALALLSLAVAVTYLTL